ncbi:MAG TPA: DUF2723 domain-containing protein [Patescibacteria group bacterium]|nr:DUF2723 domain-containing protein [Patescibacteria group bacterium]
MIIVIPTYNERENIEPTVRGIRSTVPDSQILFVDDASPDGTAEEIKRIQNTDPKILLLERSGKLGLGSAYVEAFEKILADNSTDVIVTMDADLSHPFETLIAFEEKIKNYELVVGSRYVRGGSISNWSFIRRVISRVGNWYERTFNNLPLRDVSSGFMCIRTETLARTNYRKIRARGYAFLVELKHVLVRAGASTCEVPITFSERRAGHSKFSIKIMVEAMFLPARLNPKTLFGAFVFLFSLAVYIQTAPRTIFLNDNAEFITAGKVLGIPHPTGYPLYVMLSKLFSYLPIGPLPFRINFLSILAASFSLLVLFLWLCKVLKKLSRDPQGVWVWLVAAATSLSAGFSLMFWSQAVSAKTYTLHFLILSCILLALWQWWETAEHKYFYWVCFLTALGVANHLLMLAFAPAIFLGLLYDIKRTNWKIWLKGFLFVILGLSPFLYLPIRAAQNPIYAWAPGVSSLRSFWDYIFPAHYYGLGTGLNLSGRLAFLSDFGSQLARELGLLLVMSLVGIIWIALKHKKLFFVLALAVLGNISGILFLRHFGFSLENAYFYSFYYLSAIVLMFVFMGFGLYFIYDLLKNRIGPKVSALVLVYILIPVLLLAVNFGSSNLRGFDFVENYTKSMLESLPPNAVLIFSADGPGEDTEIFGLLYQQVAAKIRPDVKIIGLPGVVVVPDPQKLTDVYRQPDLEKMREGLIEYALNEPSLANRPIYTTYLAVGPEISVHSFSNGLAYKLETGNADPYNLPETVNLSPQDEKILNADLAGSDMLAGYYYAQAAYFLDHGDSKQSENNFIQGINYDYNVYGLDKTNFMSYRNSKK